MSAPTQGASTKVIDNKLQQTRLVSLPQTMEACGLRFRSPAE